MGAYSSLKKYLGVTPGVNSRQNKLRASALANTTGVSPWKFITRKPKTLAFEARDEPARAGRGNLKRMIRQLPENTKRNKLFFSEKRKPRPFRPGKFIFSKK